MDMTLRCRCGHVRGQLSGVAPSEGFRLVCYCADCRAFAHFLERADLLDAAGGTDIFQLPPHRATLTAGTDRVRCVRLGPRNLHRWYAECCRTPIGNTGSARFPLIGVIHSFMDHQADGRPRDVALGPPRCRLFGRSAVGPLPPGAPAAPSVGLIVGRLAALLGWWARGYARPHPLFDGVTRAPIAVPRVLTPDERATLSRPAV
jgi:hypothetical protein